MKRKYARKIAETITNDQIKQMFDNAKLNIVDWTKISDINKGLTKGTAWNIMAKDFDVNANHHILAKTNMICEFGDFLPNNLKIIKVKKFENIQKPIHQKPIF